jgi:hypothetical protein
MREIPRYYYITLGKLYCEGSIGSKRKKRNPKSKELNLTESTKTPVSLAETTPMKAKAGKTPSPASISSGHGSSDSPPSERALLYCSHPDCNKTCKTVAMMRQHWRNLLLK